MRGPLICWCAATVRHALALGHKSAAAAAAARSSPEAAGRLRMAGAWLRRLAAPAHLQERALCGASDVELLARTQAFDGLPVASDKKLVGPYNLSARMRHLQSHHLLTAHLQVCRCTAHRQRFASCRIWIEICSLTFGACCCCCWWWYWKPGPAAVLGGAMCWPTACHRSSLAPANTRRTCHAVDVSFGIGWESCRY